MTVLVYLFGFSAILFFAYFLLSACLGVEKSDRVVTATILTSFQIIVTESALGAIGKLNTFYVQFVNALAFLIILGFSLFLISKKKAGIFDCNSKTLQPDLKTLFYLSLILIAYSLIFLLAVIIPPYAWDSLTFRLPAVFQWAKSQKLMLTQPIRHMSYYPQNGELLTLWIYLLTKKIHYLNLVQFPFVFLFAVSTYNLAKKLNLKETFVIIPLVLFTPVAMIQTTTSYVDVIFASFFMAALNFLIGYLQTKRNLYLLLVSVSIGLFCGVKPTGWIAALLFLIFLAVIYFVPRKSLKFYIVFLAVLLVFASGGFWYVRNFILTGNINYPFNISVFDKVIMKGVMEAGRDLSFEKWFVSQRWEWWLYPLYERIRGKFVYSIESGFGIQFVLGLISVLFSFYISILKKDKLAFFIFLLFPISIFLLFAMPNCPFPRYVIFLCGISAVAIVYVLNHLKSIYKKMLGAFITFAIIFSFSASLFQINPHQKKVMRYFLTYKTLPVYTYLSWEYGELAEIWKWVDENTAPGSVIAYNYPELIAYLYGANVNKNIVNIDASGSPYKNALRAESYEEWLEKLKEYKVSYLYVVFPSEKPNITYRDSMWAKEHPEIFVKERGWPYTLLGKVAFYRLKN